MPKYHVTSFEDRWHSVRVFLIRGIGRSRVRTAYYRDRRMGLGNARLKWRRVYTVVTVATVLYDGGGGVH
jgi:hypothetical protein